MEPERSLLLRCGRLFDPAGRRLHGPFDVVVDDGIIVSVTREPATGADEVVDLRECTLLPGLVDLDADLIPEPVSGDTGLWLYEALAAARGLLRRGFTTARVPGGADERWGLLDLRHAIAEGLAPGCELVVAPHRLDESVAEDHLDRALQRELRNGADWIAVDRRDAGTDRLRGLVKAAGDTPVAVAAVSAGETRAAIEAGARSVEVACPLDVETLEAAARSSTYLVPRDGFQAPELTGVRLCFGGRLPGGLAGLAELTGTGEALSAATSTAARCAGLLERGTIRPGQRADLVAVDGDPIADIGRLAEVPVVLKQGKLQR